MEFAGNGIWRYELQTWNLQVLENYSTFGDSYNPTLTNSRRIRRSRKKCYLLNDKRIKDLSLKYLSHGSRYEFLAAVSHVCDNLPNTALHADDSCSDDETDVYYTDSESASSSTDVAESASPAADAQPQQLKATCDVCLIAERDAVALVPCGHATFCRRCCNELVLHNHHCPLCRASISMVLDLYIE